MGPEGLEVFLFPALRQEEEILYFMAHLRGVSASGCARPAATSFSSLLGVGRGRGEGGAAAAKQKAGLKQGDGAVLSRDSRAGIRRAPPPAPIESSRGRSL